jgi:16S rRNA (cytidine1402-2'-O)-methyltransferase
LNIDASLLLQAASSAAGDQQYPAAALYVVATPIGNLADLTLRAIHVLSRVDAVACEDTRVSGALLRHLGLHKPLIALHQHNEQQAAATVLARLAEGQRVAYVSDAGTPAISDPGAALVRAADAAGHRVLPIPGASSAVAALSVAGDALASGFRFLGFLPSKSGERREVLQRLAAASQADILFEAPHRIATLADELALTQAERRVTVCRELTKQFETVATMPAIALPGWLAADSNRGRGEFVLVLHAVAASTAENTTLSQAVEHTLAALLDALPLKQAVSLAASVTGAPRNALYQRALALRQTADD